MLAAGTQVAQVGNSGTTYVPHCHAVFGFTDQTGRLALYYILYKIVDYFSDSGHYLWNGQVSLIGFSFPILMGINMVRTITMIIFFQNMDTL